MHEPAQDALRQVTFLDRYLRTVEHLDLCLSELVTVGGAQVVEKVQHGHSVRVSAQAWHFQLFHVRLVEDEHVENKHVRGEGVPLLPHFPVQEGEAPVEELLLQDMGSVDGEVVPQHLSESAQADVVAEEVPVLAQQGENILRP